MLKHSINPKVIYLTEEQMKEASRLLSVLNSFLNTTDSKNKLNDEKNLREVEFSAFLEEF